MSLVQPKWMPCTRRKLDPMIDTLTTENESKVISTLEDIDDVATTCDLWTNDQGNKKINFVTKILKNQCKSLIVRIYYISKLKSVLHSFKKISTKL